MIDFKRECCIEIIKDLVEGDSNISRVYGFILYTERYHMWQMYFVMMTFITLLTTYQEVIGLFVRCGLNKLKG